MKGNVHRDLIEASWRRRLTPEEQAHLRAYLLVHPEAQSEWEEEAALTACLRQLPDAPLASNFTAQVLEAARAEKRTAERGSDAIGWWATLRRLLPRVAGAALTVLLVGVALHQHRTQQRAQLGRSLVEFSSVATALPAPEVLQDFDAIHTLRYVPAAASDEDLLLVLQR